jgi:hypothetical protein
MPYPSDMAFFLLGVLGIFSLKFCFLHTYPVT